MAMVIRDGSLKEEGMERKKIWQRSKDIEKAFEILETDEVPDKLSYLRFLVRDLDSVLSGEHETLRYRKFKITRFKE
jgi:hypothetical protein